MSDARRDRAKRRLESKNYFGLCTLPSLPPPRPAVAEANSHDTYTKPHLVQYACIITSHNSPAPSWQSPAYGRNRAGRGRTTPAAPSLRWTRRGSRGAVNRVAVSLSALPAQPATCGSSVSPCAVNCPARLASQSRRAHFGIAGPPSVQALRELAGAHVAPNRSRTLALHACVLLLFAPPRRCGLGAAPHANCR